MTAYPSRFTPISSTQQNLSGFSNPLPACNLAACGLETCDLETCRLAQMPPPPTDAFLHSISNFLPGAIFQVIVDRDKPQVEFTYLSEKFQEIYGVAPTEVIADWQVMQACVSPETWPKVQADVRVAIENATPIDTEYCIYAASGQPKWIHAQAEPMVCCPNKIIFNGILLDITDRKLAELERHQSQLDLEACLIARTEALQATELQLQEIIKTVPGIIYQFTYQNGETYISYISDYVYEVTGYSTQQIYQNPSLVEQIVHPDDLANYRIAVIAAIQNQIEWQYEWRIVKANGEVCWLRGKAAPTILSPDYIIFNGIILDITARKLTEAALAQSETKFRGIIENASECFYIADQTGEISYLSPQFTEILGYSAIKWLRQTFVPLIHPNDLLNWIESLQNVAFYGEKQTIEYRICHQDGRWRWLTSTASPLRSDQGEIIGCVGVVRDITEQKQAEQELQHHAQKLERTLQELQRTQAHLIQTEKMSSLGQMVAGITHEINNPNNFIAGNLIHLNRYLQNLLEMVKLYQAEYPNPVQAIANRSRQIDLAFLMEDLPNVIESMTIGTNRIQKIIFSLQNFACMDESAWKMTDLHVGLDNTLVILEHRLKRTFYRPEITIVREYGELPFIACYVGELNQVFLNILNNAIEALESLYPSPPQAYDDLSVQGGLSVQGDLSVQATNLLAANACPLFAPTIWIRTKLLNRCMVMIQISNNGPSVPENIRRRLFDPFFTTKPVGKGTGMGLAISYQIITEKHQGLLEYSSTPDANVEFTITLPLEGLGKIFG
jgi:PAS domain S-box-containing protein